MRYLSVCSGIEAATVAWHELGWNPVGFSEIEPFPSQVLAHHYPDVQNFGDMTKYKEWNFGKTDMLVGGTPCQSFSVAGLRAGLDDPRGNLALVYCGMLDHFRPTWFVWENVPGVLSSNKGRDFGAFLGAVAELGYGFAYRVLDAQYFGVAQRRRRVFVVGYLGDWRPAATVLFERESLLRDTSPSRKTRQETTRDVAASTGVSCEPVAHCLQTSCHDYSRADGFNMVAQVYENHPTDSRIKPLDKTCSTVTARWGTGGGNTPIVAEPKTYCLQGNMIGRCDTAGPQGLGVNEDISFTQNATDRHGVVHPIAFGWQNSPSQGDSVSSDVTPTLDKSKTPAVAVDVYNQTIDGDVAATLTEACGGTNTSGPKLMQSMAVRRLTPIECERLQGFPDNYTRIAWRNKEPENCPDGHRYKALGNSMAVPVMRWIGEKIDAVNKL